MFRAIVLAGACGAAAVAVVGARLAVEPEAVAQGATVQLIGLTASEFECVPISLEGARLPPMKCHADNFELPQDIASNKLPRVKIHDRTGAAFEVRRSQISVAEGVVDCDWKSAALGRQGSNAARAMKGKACPPR